MRILTGISTGVAIAFGIAPAVALTVEDAVNQFIAPMSGSVNLPAGVAVGVYHRGEISFYNFGVRDGEGQPVDEHTIFEIGSVTKTFTATLLGEAVGAGRIDLNSSVVAYLPKGRTLQPAAQKVTPLELATFTSGLPDDPPDLPCRLPQCGISTYTVDDFFDFLSHWTPDGRLPAAYLYSNIGVGLLGFLVAESIDGWQQEVRDRITVPLAMADTVVSLSDGQRGRLARGYRKNGEAAPKWPVFAWAAAGALRSTSSDLVSYIEAHLGHGDAPADLIAAMRRTHKTYFRIPDKPFSQALTWRVRESGGNQRVIFKDGGTAGFSAFVGFNPAKDLGLVLLANWRGAPVVDRGLAVIGHVDDPR